MLSGIVIRRQIFRKRFKGNGGLTIVSQRSGDAGIFGGCEGAGRPYLTDGRVSKGPKIAA